MDWRWAACTVTGNGAAGDATATGRLAVSWQWGSSRCHSHGAERVTIEDELIRRGSIFWVWEIPSSGNYRLARCPDLLAVAVVGGVTEIGKASVARVCNAQSWTEVQSAINDVWLCGRQALQWGLRAAVTKEIVEESSFVDLLLGVAMRLDFGIES